MTASKSTTGKGRKAGRGGKSGSGRGKPKSAEELDAEMEGYFAGGTGGNDANGVQAANGDTAMEDEVMVSPPMFCSLVLSSGFLMSRFFKSSPPSKRDDQRVRMLKDLDIELHDYFKGVSKPPTRSQSRPRSRYALRRKHKKSLYSSVCFVAILFQIFGRSSDADCHSESRLGIATATLAPASRRSALRAATAVLLRLPIGTSFSAHADHSVSSKCMLMKTWNGDSQFFPAFFTNCLLSRFPITTCSFRVVYYRISTFNETA